MVSPQYDFANVVATEMIGQMTLNIGGSCMVSHQCELLNVSANEMIGETNLYTEGTHGVSPQCELLNIFASLQSSKDFRTHGAHKLFISSVNP
jgi:hypothetical protein